MIKEIQKKLAKTSKRKKQLLEAREFDKIAQAKKLEVGTPRRGAPRGGGGLRESIVYSFRIS